jgi:hypothetical protein
MLVLSVIQLLVFYPLHLTQRPKLISPSSSIITAIFLFLSYALFHDFFLSLHSYRPCVFLGSISLMSSHIYYLRVCLFVEFSNSKSIVIYLLIAFTNLFHFISSPHFYLAMPSHSHIAKDIFFKFHVLDVHNQPV